jgi:hypothetical protein
MSSGASSKLYLIRRENTKFIGPVNRQAFREGLRKMEFGLQDEVCGHCSTWVLLDQEEAVRKHYPELVNIITDELPVAWRELTGHAKKVTAYDKKSKSARKPDKVPDRLDFEMDLVARDRKRKLAIGFSVAAVVLLVLGGVLKMKEDQGPPLGDFPKLLAQDDTSSFLNEMGLKIIPQTVKIVKSKESLATWLPYLRAYAFLTTGNIDQVPVKVLRGSTLSPFNDCSVESWKKRWFESSAVLANADKGKLVAKNIWLKLLFQDPHWIRRRSAKNWIKPMNWHEGCLQAATLATKSLEEAATDANEKDVLQIFRKRILNQLNIIRGAKQILTVEATSVLGTLTCLDLADQPASLNTCRSHQFDSSIEALFDQYTLWQEVRMMLSNPQRFSDPPLQAAVGQIIGKSVVDDWGLVQDYGVELQLIKDIQQSGFKPEGFLERLVQDFYEGKAVSK